MKSAHNMALSRAREFGGLAVQKTNRAESSLGNVKGKCHVQADPKK